MTSKGVKGTASIKFYPGKDNTILVAKPSKHTFTVARLFAVKVVKKILDALLAKCLDDEGLEMMMNNTNKKTSDRNMKFLMCSKCEKMFTTSHGMTIHMGKAHKIEENCLAKDCDFKPNSDQELHNHMLKKHDNMIAEPFDPVPQNECQYCTKQFQSTKSLNLHIRTHEAWKEEIPRTPGPELKCHNCPFKTTSKVIFKSHNRNTQQIRGGFKKKPCKLSTFCG